MSKKPTSLDAIDAAASSAAQEAAEKSPDERISRLEEQIAKLEPLLEQQQRAAQHSNEFTEYLADLKAEQKFMNRARYVMGLLALVVIFLLMVLLLISLAHSKSPLLSAPPTAIAVYVIGILSGIVVLTLNLVKGVFHSAAERHKDGIVPQQVTTLVELLEKMRGH